MAAPRISRRVWLAGGATMAAAAAVPMHGWLAEPSPPRFGPSRHGRLRPDPVGILDLLEGFRYRVIDRAGAPMDDGHDVPLRPDGMACFAEPGADDEIVLLRNHEMPLSRIARRLLGPDPVSEAYDPAGAGGVTRLVLDARTYQVRRRNLVLAGTVMNCGGGPSPWGWLSCEESADPEHGFVFLCDPSAGSVQRPVRVDGYGRFRHEAAAVRPDDGVCYLTEDRPDGCLYRFVPHDPARPFEGRLQAMRVRGRAAEDTAPLSAGASREIDWVDLRDATPPEDRLRHRARALGAARIRRGEGACFADGALHVCASTGGPIGRGQILRLRDEGDGGTLEVIAASAATAALDMPDNVAVAPGGGLFFVEDGEGHDFIRSISEDGEVFDVGRNAASEGEIAGVCFCPSGRAMFVNLQEDGLTLAIEGPFERLRG